MKIIDKSFYLCDIKEISVDTKSSECRNIHHL
jgi:hypothetical protein